MYLKKFLRKNILTISTIFNVAVITFLIVGYYTPDINDIQEDIEKVKKKVAILSFASSPAIKEIERGFSEEMNKSKSINPKIKKFYGNSSELLVNSQVKEVISKKYDLLFTIGADCTQSAKEITKLRKSNLPVVFGNFDNPVDRNIIQSLDSSGNNLTGTVNNDGLSAFHDRQAGLLRKIMPNAQKVLIPFDHSKKDLFRKELDSITEKCALNNMDVIELEIDDIDEIIEKIEPSMKYVDVLLTLKDSKILTKLDGIIELCSKHKVPLYTSELESVEKGAAFGFGISDYETGLACAKKALEILNEGKEPSGIPITPLLDPKLLINNNEVRLKQGLEVSEELVFIIKYGELI